MGVEARMAKAYCPQCDATIALDSPREGRRISCHGCRVSLEVVGDDPFDIDFADRRDKHWSEGSYRGDTDDSGWEDGQVSPEWHEGSLLRRAAYGDYDLTDT